MTGLPEEWVGYLSAPGISDVVKVTGRVDVPQVARLDLPNMRLFGLALTLGGGQGDEIRGDASVRGEPVQFAGRSDGTVFGGRIRTSAGQGAFELRRVAIWNLADYRRLSACYDVDGGRRISVFVNADEWVGIPTLFYSEEDRVVRLYPDEAGGLLSEAGEYFTLTPDRSGLASVRQLIPADDCPPLLRIVRRTDWEDEDVTITGPAGVLSGTLMKPAHPGPHAAVMLIHGAAGGRRDMYRPYAEHFLQAGLAALVFDKRGIGESAGDGSDPTFFDKSLDAEAWVDYLQTRPDIQHDRVGVWGLSNGSWVAPMVAARRPDVAFVAVVGASGTTPVETEIHRRAFDLREQGISEEEVEHVTELWRLIYKLLVSRQPDDEHAARFDHLAKMVQASEALAGLHVQQYAIDSPFLGSVPPYQTYRQVVEDLPHHPPDSDWTCDPANYYRDIRVPVLFLVGDYDSNLPPLVSARRVSAALHESGNHRATVLLFPNTGHIMNFVEPGSDTGMTSEEAGYRFHHFRFAGGFLNIVRSWAAAQASA